MFEPEEILDTDEYDDIQDDDNDVLYIGVVGYMTQPFDEDEARDVIEDIFDEIEDEYLNSDGDFTSIAVVSGLTNKGIPKIAYEVAEERGYTTIGFVPKAAQDYDMFDVDEIIWEGDEFGDESEAFIDKIDIFVRVGGGDQAMAEQELAELADIGIYDYDFD